VFKEVREVFEGVREVFASVDRWHPYRQDLGHCLHGTVYGTDVCRIDRTKDGRHGRHTVPSPINRNDDQLR
jgi:hypothetical protein